MVLLCFICFCFGQVIIVVICNESELGKQMSKATINEKCIIGLPTCGYAFSSSRMAFIAAPSDDEFQLEIDILTSLLEEKDYEAYVALRNINPGKFAFCTKICSKIITSQFCIALLNSSEHRDHKEIKIPNPNVHMEYGLMLAFKKHILPFQRKGDSLAFNIQPLDTLLYTKSDFRKIADNAIDSSILATVTTSRPTRAIASSELLLRYLAVRGLRVTQLNNEDAKKLYSLGSPIGYNLLDGKEIVYFGMFDLESAKEIVFRVKLLIQNLHQAAEIYENITKKTMSAEQIIRAEEIISRVRIEVLISNEIEKEKLSNKIKELTSTFRSIKWSLLTSNDLESRVALEYDKIGEI